MELRTILPRPRNISHELEDAPPIHVENQDGGRVSNRLNRIPAYGKRAGFVPESVEDFSNGGAFPEIHIEQYPLEMGRKKNKEMTVVTRSNIDSIVPRSNALFIGEEYEKPSVEEEDATARETLKAIQGTVDDIVTSRLGPGLAKPERKPTYVKYTPAQQSSGAKNGGGSRLIKMMELPRDPLEPSGSKSQRVPNPPPSPPPPVVHSPPKKMTEEERKEWKIPPCVSNWKNPKGRIIPLEFRLSADGRRLQEVEIGNGHSKFSESLLSAEKTMREAVDRSNKVRLMVLEKEKDEKEKELSEMAKRVLQEREQGDDEIDLDDEDELRDRLGRDIVREDMRRQRVKDIRMSRRKGKGERDKGLERDISEQIALGQHVKQPKTMDALYDTRLFNQDSGIGKGFGGDDDYNVYDKPFHAKDRNIYKPRNLDSDTYGGAPEESVNTSKFKPDKDFEGVDRSQKSLPHSKPVEFELDGGGDDFGISEFLAEAKANSRKIEDDADERRNKKRQRRE